MAQTKYWWVCSCTCRACHESTKFHLFGTIDNFSLYFLAIRKTIAKEGSIIAECRRTGDLVYQAICLTPDGRLISFYDESPQKVVDCLLEEIRALEKSKQTLK